jgi:DNA-binding NarL/FixJ family response regulator
MKRLFIVGDDTFTVYAMRIALRYSSGVNVFGVIDGQGNVRQAIREAQPDVVVIDGLGDPASGSDRVRKIREEAPQATILLLTGALAGEALEAALEAGAIVCMSRPARLPHFGENGDGADRLASTANGVASIASRAANGLASVMAAGTNGHGPAGNGHGHAGGVASLVSLDTNGRAAGHSAAPEDASESRPSPLTRRELEILGAVAEGHTNARIGRDLWVTEQTVKFHLSNIYRKLGVSNRTEASRYALVNDLFGTPWRNGGSGAELKGHGSDMRPLAARADARS